MADPRAGEPGRYVLVLNAEVEGKFRVWNGSFTV